MSQIPKIQDVSFNFDNSYLQLLSDYYTKLKPEPVRAPRIVFFNQALAKDLGLDFANLDESKLASLFSGNHLAKGANPFAQAYAGHQFGHFTMLGDGRALILGEHITPDSKRFDIQYKGSGKTPYSRRGDGRAALGPMLRECLISEAMYALNIPSTRSLAVVTTGETVYRETPLPGAILTRIAKSHIRVGTFEYGAAKGGKSVVEPLLNYTIWRHFRHCIKADNQALALLETVMERQIDLIVNWMRVGFIHGVMNTDNVAISGETIDYGPCAFMDDYHPETVFSSIDYQGRYAYHNQPHITQWNLTRLAETLLPFLDDDINNAVKIAEDLVNAFPERYQKKWLTMMRAKLGLFEAKEQDKTLIDQLLNWMQQAQADYTNTFRDLSKNKLPDKCLYQSQEFQDWYQRYQKRLEKNSKTLAKAQDLMRTNNPCLIPRNHQVEKALNAANDGDLKPFDKLLEALKEPYKEDPKFQSYQSPPKENERISQTFCGT